MTREEAINEIKQIQCFDKPFDNSVEECNKFAKREIALNMAIKALEQEPVLDKIRAEIEQEQDDFMDDNDYEEGVRFGLMVAYQITDKYRGEDFNE